MAELGSTLSTECRFRVKAVASAEPFEPSRSVAWDEKRQRAAPAVDRLSARPGCDISVEPVVIKSDGDWLIDSGFIAP